MQESECRRVGVLRSSELVAERHRRDRALFPADMHPDVGKHVSSRLLPISLYEA
jgi:hypothetical protein